VTYKVLIVDDSAIVRRAVRCCIEQSSEFQVCGEADNGKVGVEKVQELHPDVVIVDFQMPVMNGLEAARQIAVLAPRTIMLMLTMHCCEQLVRDASVAGIRDVLSKSDAIPNLLLASLKRLQLNAAICPQP
jgi:DNA-binding NarL/FixJ family response regulator